MINIGSHLNVYVLEHLTKSKVNLTQKLIEFNGFENLILPVCEVIQLVTPKRNMILNMFTFTDD